MIMKIERINNLEGRTRVTIKGFDYSLGIGQTTEDTGRLVLDSRDFVKLQELMLEVYYS